MPTLFTAVFLHAGWAHLFGNMLFLWIFGHSVEHRLTRAGFLAAYLAAGVLGALADGVLRMGSGIPSLGASGAIAGVLGMYLLWFPRNRVLLLLILWPVALPAWLVIGVYILVDNVLPLLFAGASGVIGQVSYGAHLGGFVAGLGIAWGVRRFAGRGAEPRVQGAAGTTPRRQALRRALEGYELAEAVALLVGTPPDESRRLFPIEDKLELAAALARAGNPRAALACYQRALSEHPQDPRRHDAHLGAAKVLAHDLDAATAAIHHLYEVLEDAPDEARAAEAREMLGALRAADTAR